MRCRSIRMVAGTIGVVVAFACSSCSRNTDGGTSRNGKMTPKECIVAAIGMVGDGFFRDMVRIQASDKGHRLVVVRFCTLRLESAQVTFTGNHAEVKPQSLASATVPGTDNKLSQAAAVAVSHALRSGAAGYSFWLRASKIAQHKYWVTFDPHWRVLDDEIHFTVVEERGRFEVRHMAPW